MRLLAIIAALIPALAFSQGYPNRPVKMIIPFAPAPPAIWGWKRRPVRRRTGTRSTSAMWVPWPSTPGFSRSSR